jgi:hypothetical protein
MMCKPINSVEWIDGEYYVHGAYYLRGERITFSFYTKYEKDAKYLCRVLSMRKNTYVGYEHILCRA